MIQVSIENNFSSWRAAARGLLQNGVSPHEICWTSAAQNGLFTNDPGLPASDEPIRVSTEFLTIAETAACFDDATKWALLYRLLFRLTFENRHLLRIESDDDVRRVRAMEKAVARDVHKFHAFVRFRRVRAADAEIYVAWHEPNHWTVERAVPFFARRFGEMRFSILTPKGCAHWDREDLKFSEPVSAARAPQSDETEEFWLAYYQSIFNPFRLKIKAMKKELPMRHWRTLPEARLIPELIRKAERLNRRKSPENKSDTAPKAEEGK